MDQNGASGPSSSQIFFQFSNQMEKSDIVIQFLIMQSLQKFAHAIVMH